MEQPWIFDLEADGLNPTKIYVLSVTRDGKTIYSTSDYDKMRKFFREASVIAGHNIVQFDIPVVERILDIKVTSYVIDTLALSWCLFPTRARHGLESWGEDLGIKKPEVKDWFNLPLTEYVNRCEEDVKINYRQWQYCYRMLQALYEKEEDIWRYVEYITSKVFQARLQLEAGWKLDVKYAEKALVRLSGLRDEKVLALASVMPKVPIIKTRTRPKRFETKNGISKLGLSWLEQLEEAKLPKDTKELEYVDGYEEPNPGSHDQVKKWLYDLGWVPQTLKEVKNKKTGEIREVPQINKDKTKGGGICDSVKLLYDKEPNLELLDGLSVLNHRIGILTGFLRDVDNDDRLRARISGFTNTLRVKHTEIVNLPKANVDYGEEIRGSLVAEEGYELCGADMASLEDRLKQHYIFPLDPEYVKTMMADDFDPHLDIAVLSGRISLEEAEAYKGGDKSKKSVRDVMKNVNYAGQYGAGAARISVTGGITLEEAKKLHKIYWERNWAIKEVAKKQIVKTVNGLMWLWNPVSKFWYYLKYDKDRFSTLVQGTASFCFDTWIKYILIQRRQLTATFHDEGVWQIKKGYREQCTALMRKAIDQTNEELSLNRQLDISVQYGSRYSHIH